MRLNLTLRDLSKAPRIALSFQRIWLMLCGLLAGYSGYFSFSWLALFIAGKSPSQIWGNFYLFPHLTNTDASWYARFIYAIGILLLWLCLSIAATAISRAAYVFLKGQNFYTWREAIRFACGKISSLILAPLSLLFFILCFFITGWLISLLGNIPWIGPIGITLFTVVWIVFSLLLLFLSIIFILILILMPAILATTDEDAFEVVFQTISIIWHQPVHFMGYQAYNIIFSLLSLFVFSFSIKKAILLCFSIFQTPLVTTAYFRNNFSTIITQTFATLEKWLHPFSALFDNLFGQFTSRVKSWIWLNHHFDFVNISQISPDFRIASYILTFSLLLIGCMVLAYALATFNVSNTMSYIILRYKKENKNLLEREDAEEARFDAKVDDLMENEENIQTDTKS